MKEQLKQRTVELEIAAKNTIVEIYMMEEQLRIAADVLESKKSSLKGINAAMREIAHTIEYIKTEPDDDTDNML